MDEAAYRRELARLEAERGTLGAWELAGRTLALERSRAARLAETDDARAVEHYLAAEDAQRTLGTFATGSGEGLASMAALYAIMADRARLHERLGRTDAAQAALAVETWQTIVDDPNGQGLPHQRDLERARGLG
ncbi:MAG: hypothetical protein H6746_01795 [Deltaproteobacteria bacterium]|nr:hypothetical protein [Deltaproteobacteria bacterium]